MFEKIKSKFMKKNIDLNVKSTKALEDRNMIDSDLEDLQDDFNVLAKECYQLMKKDDFNNNRNLQGEHYRKITELKKMQSKGLKINQGKVKNIISACFNQVDKRIWKKLFDNETVAADKRWKFFENRVWYRYQNLPHFIVERGAAIVIIGVVSFSLAKFLPIWLLALLNAPLVINTIGDIISTKYNNKHFNGPHLVQHKDLYNGSYLDNIKNAIYEYRKSDEIQKQFANITDVNEVIDNLRIQDEENKPKMSDYGNLGMCTKIESDDMNYLKAYSAIRKSNDNEKRMEAYAKLSTTYGKNPSKNKKTNKKQKLSEYSKMLKNLSMLGRKINSGNSSKEDNTMYINLLYRLGKDFDDDYDITDFLSDEYDRYQEDLQQYEKGKVLRK